MSLSQKKDQSTSTQSIPPWLEQAMQWNIDQGQALSNRQYTPYEGNRQAGFNDMQKGAYNTANQYGNMAPEAFQNAYGLYTDTTGQGMMGNAYNQMNALAGQAGQAGMPGYQGSQFVGADANYAPTFTGEQQKAGSYTGDQQKAGSYTGNVSTAGFNSAGNAARGNLSQSAGQNRNDARDIQGGSFLGMDRDAYTNQFTQGVSDNVRSDMNRMAELQKQQGAGAAAAAGAFGGSRHGVQDAVTNSEAQRNYGQMSNQLNAQAFDAASGLMGQDLGRNLQAQQANQGVDTLFAQLGQANNQFNAGQGNMMEQFNAGQSNQMGMFNAGQANQLGMWNAGAENAMSQFNAGQLQQGDQWNAGQGNMMNQFNAGQLQQGDQWNAGQGNMMNQFNAGQQQQGGQFNANVGNNMNQFNAGNMMQNNQFNAGNQLQRDYYNMQGGLQGLAAQSGLLANMGNLGQGLGQLNLAQGGALEGFGQSGMGAQEAAGNQIMGMDQAQLSQMYNDFLEARDWAPSNFKYANAGMPTQSAGGQTTQDVFSAGTGQQLLGAGTALGGAALGKSHSSYKDIHCSADVDAIARKVLDMQLYSWTYLDEHKPQSDDPPRIGPLAEDFGLAFEGKERMEIDYQRHISALHATVQHLNARLEKLENK